MESERRVERTCMTMSLRVLCSVVWQMKMTSTPLLCPNPNLNMPGEWGNNLVASSTVCHSLPIPSTASAACLKIKHKISYILKDKLGQSVYKT